MTSWKDWKHCSCLRPCFVYCLKPCFSSLGEEYGFKDCKHLDFSHCNLKEVPDEVFSLERTLEELLLDVNSIRDLPRVVFHCTGLKKLSISDNEIETLPNAISSLVYLEYLNLSRNSLLVIPDGIKCCKCLIVLDCSVNPLGKVPDSLTQLINLQELYLNDTFLEYLPANFGRLSRLRIVELRENHIKILPKSFQRLINLERLDIGQNELAEFPEVLCNLTNLQELWIDGNRISSLPETLGNLTNLTYLDASENRIVAVASNIAACHKLTDLLLSGNKIVELPETLGSLKYLTYLRLDDNKLTSLPQSIGGLSSLQEFVMSNNYIQSLPKNIGFLRNLHSLIMDCNKFKTLPDTICSCSKLRLLSVASNDLSELPDDIGRLSNLKVLNLRNNQLKFLPYSFANITNLRTLWLSDNQQKPIMKLQTDTDEITGKKVLTCFLLPQQAPFNPDEAYLSDHDDPSSSSKGESKMYNSESRIKFYSASGEIDEKDDQFISKLVRNPTPYPKELKAHARHARNLALKRRDSFGNGEDDDFRPKETLYQQPSNSSKGPDRASHTEIKEAKLTKASKCDRESSVPKSELNYESQQTSDQYHQYPAINQEEQTMLLKQSNSPVTFENRDSPSLNIATQNRNTANPPIITDHPIVESKMNFYPQFPSSANECYSMVVDQQNRPVTIYNNNSVENLLSNYQVNLSSQENSRSNHQSPPSSLSPPSCNQHQTLEKQLLMRTAGYSVQRETPSSHHASYFQDNSSSSNPLIGLNEANRSSIKNLSSHSNVSGSVGGENNGAHILNFSGPENKVSYRNHDLHQTLSQNQNLPISSEEAKRIHSSSTTNPSTSQIVHQSLRHLSNDAINNQLSKIMLKTSTSITPNKITPFNESDKFFDKKFTCLPPTATSTNQYRYISSPAQVIYQQFSMGLDQLPTNHKTHALYHQNNSPTAMNPTSTTNQQSHLYNQHKSSRNESSLISGQESFIPISPQPTDSLLTTTTNSSGS
ncbi:erbin [Tetranychus urticae]|nr:erbin [Tetranychus urticae]